MAKYPIKMLKDEEGNAFVPLTSSEALKTPDGKTLDEKLQNKLETTNIKAGTDINITVDGNNVTINNASKGVLIDNLTTETSGIGSLDAHQGKVLKEMIPEVVNNVTSTDSDKALSAYQGYLLSGKVVPTGGREGQVLKKSSDTNWSLEWGDAADPNAIVGDGSIKKIIELTYEEYQALETIDPDTEYHIYNVEDGTYTYISEGQIQKMINNSIVDNLTETSSDTSLSSNQGKILYDEIGKIQNAISHTPSLIGEIVANSFVSKLKLDNLSITPGIYEIVYAEYSNGETGPGHVLRLNDITTGYQGTHIYPSGLSTGGNATIRVAYHGNCLAYVNGWSMGSQLNYGTYTLYYFNKDWITASGQSVMSPNPSVVPEGGVDGKWNILIEQGSYNGKSLEQITSISIESLDKTLIGPGSYIRVYKK